MRSLNPNSNHASSPEPRVTPQVPNQHGSLSSFTNVRAERRSRIVLRARYAFGGMRLHVPSADAERNAVAIPSALSSEFLGHNDVALLAVFCLPVL